MSGERSLSAIEGLIDLLARASPERGCTNGHQQSLKVFSGARVLGLDMADGVGIFSDATLKDIKGLPFDIPCLAIPQEGQDTYTFRRWSQVAHKHYRGRIKVFCPITVLHSVATLNPETNRFFCVSRLLGYQSGKWIDVERETARGRTDRTFDSEHLTMDQEWVRDIPLAMGCIFTDQMYWRASVALDLNPAISFWTDPIGVRELLKTRDVPAGMKRRAALVHWVASHNRKQRNDPDALSEVRSYLRGKRDATWNGMTVKVIPSRDDLILNKENPNDQPIPTPGVAAQADSAL
jgi:hypothetical protein